MKELTVAEVMRATGARLLSGNQSAVIRGVTNDSRQVKPGNLFFALRGEAADGHSFVARALAGGAAAALVERGPVGGEDWGGGAILQTEDSCLALGSLAGYYLESIGPRVIGITGSVGKTTTKEMIAAVLSEKYPTLKNEGNLNTEVGLPLTIFRLEPEHRVAVLEMGMRGLGQIRYLAGIARPQMGVITNIGETHLELLGSVANIAAAKGELLEALPANGTAVLNGDDPWCRKLADLAPGRVVFYGIDSPAQVRAEDVENWQAEGIALTAVYAGQRVRIRVLAPGRHNVSNALAAVAVGWQLGLEPVTIAAGLLNYRSAKMRLEVARSGGITIINDAYNANPKSMEAAIKVLMDLAGPARPVAVLGDMLELGEYEAAGHHQVGECAASNGVKLLVTVGDRAGRIAVAARSAGMPAAAVVQCADNGEALARLPELVQTGDFILVKGSRGMKMEEIVAGLQNYNL